MKRNIYITGGGGYLGSSLIRTLIESREYNIHISFDDVRNLRPDHNIKKADIVIHLAAKHPSYQGDDIEDINYKSTKFLIDHISDNCHFIFLSSEHVFSGIPQEEYDVNSNRYPSTKYGKTKKSSEDYIMTSKKKYSIIRTSMLFGGEDNKRKNFINFFLEQMSKENKVDLYTDVYCRPTHVDDMVEFIHHIMKEKITGVYHASGTQYLNRYEIAKIIYPHESDKKDLLVPALRPKDSWLRSFNLLPSLEFKKFSKRKFIQQGTSK